MNAPNIGSRKPSRQPRPAARTPRACDRRSRRPAPRAPGVGTRNTARAAARFDRSPKRPHSRPRRIRRAGSPRRRPPTRAAKRPIPIDVRSHARDERRDPLRARVFGQLLQSFNRIRCDRGRQSPVRRRFQHVDELLPAIRIGRPGMLQRRQLRRSRSVAANRSQDRFSARRHRSGRLVFRLRFSSRNVAAAPAATPAAAPKCSSDCKPATRGSHAQSRPHHSPHDSIQPRPLEHGGGQLHAQSLRRRHQPEPASCRREMNSCWCRSIFTGHTSLHEPHRLHANGRLLCCCRIAGRD